MRIFGKDLDREIAVVAEIGVNHEGDPAAAARLIRLAAEAGADAVKFQTYTPERYAAANDPERLARVRRFALSASTHRELAKVAVEARIGFFSSALTEDVVPLLAELGEAVKIASGDLDFEPVIRAAASSGRKVILSTGLGTLEEIDRAVGWVRDEIGGAALADRLILMQCTTAYPTPVEDAHVAVIPALAARYGVNVGYSNHVLGPAACYAAVALGAPILEVHFTDRKEGRTFRDHAISTDPAEMRALVDIVPAIRAAVGTSEKGRQPSELPLLAAVRKGVVASRDLAPGTVLARDDLMYARPASEFSAADIAALVGRTLRQRLKAGQLVPRDGLAASSSR
jgi:N,N'-diacetyllegionaminate synthase